jgi:uncharacterized Zn finger protein
MSRKKQYEARTPLAVAGGIRSQAGRARQTRHWWGHRWIALLEAFMLGSRLGRGRGYAASGQVTNLELGRGIVTAVVQGASPEPYRVVLRFQTLEDAGKRKLLAALHRHPVLAGRLLVRELPPELEDLFREAGCTLFPEKRQDLAADCSCPDYVNPCKHAAAVEILLAEAIDRDPLLLLALRGLDRADLIGRPGDAGTAKSVSGRRASQAGAGQSAPQMKTGTLPADPAAFWGIGRGAGTQPEEAPDFGPAPAGEEIAPLVRRLGSLPFWRGEERFLDAMHTVYTRSTPRGWAVWSNERLDLSRGNAETPAAAPRGFRLRRNRMHMDLMFR